jgi:predicted acyl esterase
VGGLRSASKVQAPPGPRTHVPPAQATGPATRTVYTCSDLLALEEAMPRVYLEELVGTKMEDGLLLDGAVIRPDGVEAKPVAVVWIHGFTGNFYVPRNTLNPRGRHHLRHPDVDLVGRRWQRPLSAHLQWAELPLVPGRDGAGAGSAPRASSTK